MTAVQLHMQLIMLNNFTMAGGGMHPNGVSVPGYWVI